MKIDKVINMTGVTLFIAALVASIYSMATDDTVSVQETVTVESCVKSTIIETSRSGRYRRPKHYPVNIRVLRLSSKVIDTVYVKDDVDLGGDATLTYSQRSGGEPYNVELHCEQATYRCYIMEE